MEMPIPEEKEKGAQRYPEMKTHHEDMRETEFSNGIFDCVVSTSTLDHFGYAEELPQARQDGLVPYLVGHTLTRDGLQRLLEEAGFRIRDNRPVMHCPGVLAIPLRE